MPRSGDEKPSKSKDSEEEPEKKSQKESKRDRNEKSHSRKQSSKQRKKKETSSKSETTRGRNTIKLIYKKGHRYVKIVDFVAVSQLIKQHQVTGRVPRSIDLTDYFDSTITIFADYIEKGEVKTKVSFYSLAELLKLTKTFVMEDLQRRLEETLILTADTSTEHLIQAVLVAGTSNITKETENALHYLASWSFVEMANLPDFQRIPYHQFVMLLASCELQVSHELVVADAALLWLVGQPHPAVYAPGVFAMIRSAYLSKVDRQLIVERIATLQMPESVARFARVSMESRHNARICLEGTHINRHLVRCGIPDPENRPKETSLSLSRPRDGIRWSDKNLEEQKESKPRRSRSRRRRSRDEESSKSSKKHRHREKSKALKGKVKNAFGSHDSEDDSRSRRRRKESGDSEDQSKSRHRHRRSHSHKSRKSKRTDESAKGSRDSSESSKKRYRKHARRS